MYEVNERGIPELLSIGNRQFLMMAGRGGSVTPVEDDTGVVGRGNVSISVPLTINGDTDKMLAAELRREIEQTCERMIRRHS